MSKPKKGKRLGPGELDGLVLTYMREHEQPQPLPSSVKLQATEAT